MGRLTLLIFGFLIVLSAMAVTVPSPTTIQKLYYRIPKSKKLLNKDYLTIKGQDFVILAKRYEEKDDHIYWKTTKIRIKNKEAIQNWPYSIRQLLEPLEQNTTPVEPVIGIDLYAAPISFGVLNKTKNINAGYNLRTLTSTKHELNHSLTIMEMSSEDNLGNESSTMMLNSQLVYDFNNFYKNWTYFALLNFRQQKFNGDYPIRHAYGLGILGFKYKFIKNAKYIKNLDLSYVPIYEEVLSDFEIQNPGEEPSKRQSYLRNSFRLRLTLELEKWSFNYLLNYRPAYYFKMQTLDMQDTDILSTASINYSLNEKVQLGFSNSYTRDIRLFRASGMRPDNTINTYSVNVSLSI